MYPARAVDTPSPSVPQNTIATTKLDNHTRIGP
jgi:hypothetical protein